MKPPKKKRVRREKLELTYFRDLAGTLEDKLELLHTRRVNQLSYAEAGVVNPIAFGLLPVESETATAWMDFAAQQLKKRTLAVKKNQKLRYSLKQQFELTMKLKKLVHNHIAERVTTQFESANPALYEKFWDFEREAEEEVFTDQLASVARLRLTLQQGYQAPCRTLNFTCFSRGELAIRKHPNVSDGVVFDMHWGTTVPFKLEVAARAYWKFFCFEHGETSHGDTTTDISTGTIARSFSLRVKVEGLTSEASGKYTCQKFVTKDEITFLWVENADVLEFGGVKYNGMQYQKRACMKLRRVFREGPGNQSSSTVVETHYETIPVFRTNAANQLQQTQTFISSAQRSHSNMDKLVSQRVSKLLLEEDWKETFGEHV